MGALSTKDAQGRIFSRNPATGEVIGEVPEHGPEEVRQAVARAREAQREWGSRTVRERAGVVGLLRDAIVRDGEALCELLMRESGKTRHEAFLMEVLPTADLATYFVRRAPQILAPHEIPMHLVKHRASYVHYMPRGVVGVISPWNYPLGIPAGETLMALVAGNGVVLKPSEVTPLIALKMKELFTAAGLPDGLLQVVTGRGPTGAALVDAGIDYCIFTGSTATGRKVAAACGERLIPCAMELGGKSPAIVCADADLERTARALVWGGFANQGQTCAAVERVYAHQVIHDELVERLVRLTGELRQGDPSGSAPLDAGSMTWERQVEIVEERLRDAVEAGARVRIGGARVGQGLGFQPTVVTECRHEMDIMRREIFGPVLPVMRVRDDEEAVTLANDSPLALTAYVFTSDRHKGRRLAEPKEAGTVMVNDCLITFGIPETPWHGLKQSGIGRTHSDEGLRDLCQLRHVNYDRLALKRELWWYPYSEKLYRQGLKYMKWIFR
jgi:succinate-semialdehyde dehydrogenase/glutarate-semialdehyde dehydrogenase